MGWECYDTAPEVLRSTLVEAAFKVEAYLLRFLQKSDDIIASAKIVLREFNESSDGGRLPAQSKYG